MIDLHTHTIHSDGQQTVAELLQKAENCKLEYLSITDHDTVGAYTELSNPKIRGLFSGKIIPGIEIIFIHDDVHNELLGYGVDSDKLSKVFTAEKRFNDESEVIRGMYKVFSELGFKLRGLDEIIKNLREQGIGRVQILNDLHSEENLAHACKEFGIASTHEFRQWRLVNTISLTGKYSYPRPKLPDMKTVSKIIRDAGGLVFIAHVFRVGSKAIEMLDYAVKNRLIDGIEIYYNDSSVPFTKEQVEILEKYAKENNLLVSGGSDCHRVNHPLTKLSKEKVTVISKLNEMNKKFI